MTATDIMEYVDSHPGPFKLTLTGGESFYIEGRYQIMALDGTLALGIYDNSGAVPRRKLTLVSIPNVTTLKTVDRLPPRRGRGR
jgi:hypothetical protein